MLEFIFDTTRTVSDLVFTGVFARFPNIQWLFTHGGGALPLLADRMEMVRGFQTCRVAGPTVPDQLRELWFDMAGTPFPNQVPALIKAFGSQRLLYGSDYCWTPAASACRNDRICRRRPAARRRHLASADHTQRQASVPRPRPGQRPKMTVSVGLPRIRFHDLRHTHASLLVAAGVPIKVVLRTPRSRPPRIHDAHLPARVARHGRRRRHPLRAAHLHREPVVVYRFTGREHAGHRRAPVGPGRSTRLTCLGGQLRERPETSMVSGLFQMVAGVGFEPTTFGL